MTTLDERSRAMIDTFLSRRNLLRGAAAASTLVAFNGFQMTQAIYAQQLTGSSLYDQLGGQVGIVAVMNTFIDNVAGDDRINGFFAGLPAQRIARLKELLIQQVSAASGGPVRYTGRDMKTVHAGMGISTADFNALVEDLVMALSANDVPDAAQQLLLGALAPLANDIVERPTAAAAGPAPAQIP
jgi:hemoglobin